MLVRRSAPSSMATYPSKNAPYSVAVYTVDFSA